ncbi:MAG: hypothetical protein P8R54_32030 [Myxococcota bacterium]|nr:hypothetical protein [Myxococcota bacterium]
MKPLIEVVQFIPVLTLAAGFVLAGEIDLSVAAARFAIAAVLAVLIVGGLTWKKVRLNPFLVGADLWLLVGAVSFNLPIEPVKAAMVAAGGGGIFVGALLVGLAYTLTQPEGYLGVVSDKTRPLSVVLLVLTAAGAAWAVAHPDSIRLGAALPFIAVNVLRRVMGRIVSRQGAILPE